MGHEVGIDLIDVEDVQGAIDTFGTRYLTRAFTPGERHRCGTNSARLAETFAAKEAVMKALAVGDNLGAWQEIEVTRSGGARASVQLSGAAARRAEERGVARLQISLARQRHHAVAIAMLEATR